MLILCLQPLYTAAVATCTLLYAVHCCMYIQVKQNHGLKGIFKDESKTKAPLKAQSESDKEQWLRTIKSLDTSAAPSPHING
jgi:hypothetical protein